MGRGCLVLGFDDHVTPWNIGNVDRDRFAGSEERNVRRLEWGKYVEKIEKVERTNNALLVFYDKVVPQPLPELDEGDDEDVISSGRIRQSWMAKEMEI